MFLIVGLGNPGKKYQGTRHNVGYLALDILSVSLNIKMEELKCMSLVGEGLMAGEKVVLAKPLTYMNESGVAVSCLKSLFKLNVSNIIVIFDDMDLPVGYIRVKPSGGSGGHKGVDSISKALGSYDFGRVRIGIGRSLSGDEVKHVLSPFTNEEQKEIQEKLSELPEIISSIFTKGYNYTMSTFNKRVKAKK